MSQDAACHSGQAAGKGKGNGVNPARGDTHGRSQRPVLHDGPDLQTKRGPVKPQIDRKQAKERDARDKDAVPRNRQVPDGPAFLEGLGQMHGLKIGAEEKLDDLLNNHAGAPGGQQAIERALVEKADQTDFQQEADQRGHEKCCRDRVIEIEMQTEVGAPVLAKQAPQGTDQNPHGVRVRHDERGVGAEHHHVPVGHVDDAHHAERDR